MACDTDEMASIVCGRLGRFARAAVRDHVDPSCLSCFVAAAIDFDCACDCVIVVVDRVSEIGCDFDFGCDCGPTRIGVGRVSASGDCETAATANANGATIASRSGAASVSVIERSDEWRSGVRYEWVRAMWIAKRSERHGERHANADRSADDRSPTGKKQAGSKRMSE